MLVFSARRIAGVALAIGMAFTGLAANAADFFVKGTGQDGAPYEGRVVTDVVGQTVKVVWQIGSSRYIGNGVLFEDALAIYYVGNLTGVALYKRDPNTGIWRGLWTSGNSNKVGTEQWIPAK